ncbi:MAG: hypothetical protein FJY17_00355 [Bacteroidetes bacterium]|nr:hypothetical protein [Bacteroidota bacterium]
MVRQNIIIADAFLVTFIIVVILILGLVSAINLLPFFFILVGLFCILYGKGDLVVLLFLIMMTTNNIIPQNHFIFGYIGVQQVLGLLTLIVVTKKNITQTSTFISSINVLLYYTLIYVLYTAAKNFFFNMFEHSLGTTAARFVNFSFLIYCIYLSINWKRDIVFRATIASIFFLALTTLLSETLFMFGYYISIDGDDFSRYNGFIGNGDANTLALVMVIGIGVILNFMLVYKWLFVFILPIILSLLTLGLTGSRSGLILLIVTVILYLFSQRTVGNIFKSLFTVIVVSVLSIFFLQTNIERITSSQEDQFAMDSGAGNRLGKWVVYLNYFRMNPGSILRGADKVIEVEWNGAFMVAHNLYIQIVYNAGIFFLLSYLFFLNKIFLRRKEFNGNILFVMLPFLIGTFYVSDYGSLFFFIYALVSFTKQLSSGKDTFNIDTSRRYTLAN